MVLIALHVACSECLQHAMIPPRYEESSLNHRNGFGKKVSIPKYRAHDKLEEPYKMQSDA